jgi:hypothetical protein
MYDTGGWKVSEQRMAGDEGGEQGNASGGSTVASEAYFANGIGTAAQQSR